MPTDEFYANYFFSKIDFDWLEHAKNWTWFQKIEGFKNENNQKVSLIEVLLLILYFSMKKKFRQIRLIFDFICHLLRALINPNQWKNNCRIIYQWAYNLLLVACLALNSTTVIMLKCANCPSGCYKSLLVFYTEWKHRNE